MSERKQKTLKTSGNVGRPSKFTKKLARDICDRLENGETLLAICECEGMPARSTVNRWLDDKSDFRDSYTRARNYYVEYLLDEISQLNGELRNGMIKADVHRSLVDALKWKISKINARRYGELLKHELSGSVTLTVTDALNDLEDDE